MQNIIRAFIRRDFTDAGLGVRYKARTVVEIERGAFENYRAAGLAGVARRENAAPMLPSPNVERGA
jgi:hypothetical protein